MSISDDRMIHDARNLAIITTYARSAISEIA